MLSVDIVLIMFSSYAGPSGILASGRKQNTTQVSPRAVRVDAPFINYHEQT